MLNNYHAYSGFETVAYTDPICDGGFEMDYKGARFDFDKFIYQAPFIKNSYIRIER